jgi:spore cortex formation protein SpoVR/YcgB (stage V sporulation)|tara:strand:+ start:1017 stop:1448 length:432 start_codon:yes stop_codon:yes gene_type:complete
MHIKLTNGTPAKYTLGQLRRDNSDISFPKTIPNELLASYDVYPYAIQDVEVDSVSQNKVEGQFEQVGGQWTLSMVASNKPQAEVEQHVRSVRDELLILSDWTQMPDSPLDSSTKTSWATYRTALRDVSAQAGFPTNITWPTAP